jgi:hypothetical protein
MKISSMNICDLGIQSKNMALKALVREVNLDIFLLHETMGESVQIISLLSSLFLGWEFQALDSTNNSSGLATVWR